MAVRGVGLVGQYWALVKLLIDKRLITTDELKAVMEAEAGDRMLRSLKM